MSEPGDLDPIEEIRKRIRDLIAEGFHDERSVRESASYFAKDTFHDLDDASIEGIVRDETVKAFNRQFEAQRDWPAVTDCDRLDAAFAELNAAGIVARQDFTCCGTCGRAGIGDEIDKERAARTPVVGYTFYHWQGTESAVAGHGLSLWYGHVSADEDDSVDIGHRITETLERHGLMTDWDGDIGHTIHVELKWQRRLKLEQRSH